MRIFLLQLLAVTSLAARPHRGIELEDVDNFRIDGQGLMQQTVVDELAEHGPAHCQETRKWTELSKTKCEEKEQRCFIKNNIVNSEGECVSRCTASDPYLDGWRDFAPWKSVANCERHGFCSFNFSKESSPKCKEKAGCTNSLTKDGKLDQSNFFTCLDELGFKAFKKCGTGKAPCFEANPNAMKERCRMAHKFQVSNPIDCMAGGVRTRPIGQKTVALTVTENDQGQKVFECRQESQTNIADADPFWRTCETPTKGQVPKEITAGVEQHMFVRYGNDEIRSCRDTWKEDKGKKIKLVHQKFFRKCLEALDFKPYQKYMLLKCEEDKANVKWHEVDTYGKAADCLAFGPAVIMKLEKEEKTRQNKIYCTRVREDCLDRKTNQKDMMKDFVKKNGFPTGSELNNYFFARENIL